MIIEVRGSFIAVCMPFRFDELKSSHSVIQFSFYRASHNLLLRNESMKWVLGQSIYNVDSNTIVNGENPIVSILNLNPLNRESRIGMECVTVDN